MDSDQSVKQLSFLATLAADIEHALRQVSVSNTASARRNALRAIISAMEGATWIYRMHILSVAQSMDVSTQELEWAFSETSIFISEAGQIKSKQNFVPTTAMIRLATRTAQEMCGITIDFTNSNWQKVKNAIKLRNRITHPKSIEDLEVSQNDLESSYVGFNWLLTTIADVMEATLKALSVYVSDAKDLIAKLSAGDPDTLALYERVRREPED